MKKFLLSAFAVAACASTAMATTWTIPMKGENKPAWTIGTGANGKGEVTCQATVDGKTFDIAINQNTSSTKVDGIASASELRWYKNMKMTIKADGVTLRQIVFQGMYEDKCVSFTPSAETGGTVAVNKTGETATNNVSWTNDAGVDVFEGVTDKGQIRANEIVISDEVGGVVTPDPAPVGGLFDVEFTSNAGFTFEDGTLPTGLNFVWTRDANYNYMKASGYYKQNYAVDGAYLVSPVADLAGLSEVTLTFDQCVGHFKDASGTFISPDPFCKICVREEGGEWGQPIDIPSFPAVASGKNFSSFEVVSINISAYAGKKIQVGFRYSSTTATAGTWEIKSAKLTGTQDAGVEAIAEENADAPVEYFNLQGVRVAEPANGIFIRRQGGKVTKVAL